LKIKIVDKELQLKDLLKEIIFWCSTILLGFILFEKGWYYTLILAIVVALPYFNLYMTYFVKWLIAYDKETDEIIRKRKERQNDE